MSPAINMFDLIGDLDAADAELTGPSRPAPTPVHAAAAEVFAEIFSMAGRLDQDQIPPAAMFFVKGFAAMRPMVFEMLAGQDPDTILAYMHHIRSRVDLVLTAGGQLEGAPVDAGPTPIGPATPDPAAGGGPDEAGHPGDAEPAVEPEAGL